MNNDFWNLVLKILETAWLPILEAVAGIIIGPRVKRVIEKVAQKSNDKGIMTFIGSAANIIIITIGFILAAEALGIKMTSVVSLLSAVGLGISLALKSNMANVAGGLQILLTKPFKVGDFIKVSEHKGYVETIELMFTTLRSNNDKEIVIPNSTIVDDVITNYSHFPALRVHTKFSAAVGKDFSQLSSETEKILRNNPYILKDQEIKVTIHSILSGYVTLDAIGYAKVEDFEKCRHQILEDVVMNLSFYNDGNIPKPSDVTVTEETPEEGELHNPQSASLTAAGSSDSKDNA